MRAQALLHDLPLAKSEAIQNKKGYFCLRPDPSGKKPWDMVQHHRTRWRQVVECVQMSRRPFGETQIDRLPDLAPEMAQLLRGRILLEAFRYKLCIAGGKVEPITIARFAFGNQAGYSVALGL